VRDDPSTRQYLTQMTGSEASGAGFMTAATVGGKHGFMRGITQ